MPLLLEVISGHAGGMGTNRHHVVRAGAVRIGRDPSCEWVFPDPYVSRHHVTVRCLNQMYFVEGKGRTPVALNDRNRVLRNDEPQPIGSGDVLFIDEYEVRAVLVDDAEAERLAAPAGRVDTPLSAPLPQSIPFQGTRDPLDILGGGRPTTPPQPPAPLSNSNDILGRAYRPSPVQPSQPTPVIQSTTPNQQMRDDWLRGPATAPQATGPATEGLSDDWFQPAPPSATPPPVMRAPAPTTPLDVPSPVAQGPAVSLPAAAAGSSDSLRAILAGAGLDAARLEIPAQTAMKLGAVLRIVVEGTMDVLRARGEIKRQFRLPTTQISRQDNNPLKHSADAADALFNLLVKQNAAYLGVEEAFQDGFEEIRYHQLALLKGMQAGFDNMMVAFDPARFEEKGDSVGPLRALAGGGKARHWERYMESFNRLTSDREDAFRRLFGDAFATAYEAELQRLKTIRRNAVSGTQRGTR